MVALALFDKQGRVLLQQRLPGKRHGGLWELPGGKVEEGELPRAALAREIHEELGLRIDPESLRAGPMADEAGAPAIVLLVYVGEHDGEVPEGRDGQQWGWFGPVDAASLALAPMDRDLLARLDWPET